MGYIYLPKYRRSDGTTAISAVYWCKYFVNGQPRRESTKQTSERAARGVLRVKEGDAERGIAAPPKVNRKTVDDILSGVVQDYRINNRRSLDKVEARIRLHLSPVFGRWNAASVSDDLVRDFIDKRQQAEASNAEINRELAILRRGYALAKKMVTQRPDIPKLEEAPARSGFFELEQFEAVCRHLPPALVPAFRFAYLTGWRIHSEVLSLPWRLVDFEAGEVHLEAAMTKNARPRKFPFTRSLGELLTAQRAYTDSVQRERGMVVPWVFHRNGNRVKDFYGAWDKACEQAGCPDRIAHDLRRTGVRNLVRAGVSENVAMAMTGHKTRAVFERYNITSDADLLAAAAKLDAVNSVTGKVSGKVAPIQAQLTGRAGGK